MLKRRTSLIFEVINIFILKWEISWGVLILIKERIHRFSRGKNSSSEFSTLEFLEFYSSINTILFMEFWWISYNDFCQYMMAFKDYFYFRFKLEIFFLCFFLDFFFRDFISGTRAISYSFCVTKAAFLLSIEY